ncbi:MAG: hypothetical protein OEW42_03835 [Acidimicrobiia bacterium]|nr:hypothetical protein [Acidimicrobiia bacterium]MDH5238002.1 hypothetical protein [Acidimicrobiia bacterium]
MVLLVSLLAAVPVTAAAAAAPPEASSAHFVRELTARELGLASVSGLSGSATDTGLVAAGPAIGGGTAASTFSLGRGVLAQQGVAVSPAAARSLSLDPVQDRLVVLSEGRRGVLSDPVVGAVSVVDDGAGPVVEAPAAATHDRRGVWYVVDAEAHALRAIDADGLSSTISLGAGTPGRVAGVAQHPANGRLHVSSADGRRVVAIDDSGDATATIDLVGLGLSRGGPIVFAPSSDSTDASDVLSLYVSDGDRVVEAALGSSVVTDRDLVTRRASFVRNYDLAAVVPPSPDPAGVVWMADRGQLLISDPEVDESPRYAGRNLLRLDPVTGAVPSGATNTDAYSDEPTGVAYDAATGRVFVSDDDKEEIFVVRPGADDVHGTSDDSVTQFDVFALGSTDPEDVAFGNGDLYVVDGVNREVYVVGPGANGVFDGQPAAGGDDVSRQFDVGRYGPVDPEGIAYRSSSGTLLVVDHLTEAIYELTTSGELVATIDLLGVGLKRPSGITIAPASAATGKDHLYLVDLGIDNDVDPDENDGRLVEVREVAGPAPILLCEGERATVAGSSLPEMLVGTAGRDIIVARGGNDIIDGRGGNDVICGGGGDDTIVGGRGADQIFGQAGNDVVDASIGKDFVNGGPGRDTLRGGLGRDVVWGGGGFDECWGERMRCEKKHRTLHDGTELQFCQGVRATIVGGPGPDRLRGTPGDDVIVALGGRDVIDAGRGDDLVCAGAGRDKVVGGRGADSIYGGAGADVANGGGGKDFVHGGGGDDVLRGGLGADQVWGAGGTDECWGERMRCEVKHPTFHDGRPR